MIMSFATQPITKRTLNAFENDRSVPQTAIIRATMATASTRVAIATAIPVTTVTVKIRATRVATLVAVIIFHAVRTTAVIRLVMHSVMIRNAEPPVEEIVLKL